MIVSKTPTLALESRIACRSDPAPESSVLVTVNVAPDTEMDELTAIVSRMRRVENFIETLYRRRTMRVAGRETLQEAGGCKAFF